jgi:hypothetical protein
MMVISSLRSHAEPSMTRRHNSTRNMSQVVPLALASSASARGSFAARGDAPRGVRARRLLSTPPKVGTGISCTSVPGRGAGGGGGEGEEGDTPAPTSALGRRRSAVGLSLLAAAGLGGGAARADQPPTIAGGPAVTTTIYFDIGLCSSVVRADRALGECTPLHSHSAPCFTVS